MKLEAVLAMPGRDNYEKIARFFVEGSAGLFDMYRYEMASPFCQPKEVEGARWMLACLINPVNREFLDALMTQADARSKAAEAKETP